MTTEHDETSVVAVGNPFDGIVLYGPFKTADEANGWADCNPVTDLSNETWWVMRLERTTDDGEG